MRRNPYGGSRFPHGKRGLKLATGQRDDAYLSRFPHGKRGLKSNVGKAMSGWYKVASPTGSVD